MAELDFCGLTKESFVSQIEVVQTVKNAVNL